MKLARVFLQGVRPLPFGDALPTEFCIFDAGRHESSKGSFLFDADAAASVMAAYQLAGVDLMIDLNHDALLSSDLRSDASDARGWFKLSLRPDGSLWAVDVKWTPDGARRLTEKTQRYTSPAFLVDEDGRIRELTNVAICAMPATYDAAPLVAASRRSLARNTAAATVLCTKMDPEQIKAAIEALKNGDGAGALTILEAIVVSAATDGAEDAADGGADEATEMSTAPDQATAAGADTPVAQALTRATGTETLADALALISTLSMRVAALDVDRATFDTAQRVELVAELVKLGYDTPATAWEGDAARRIVCKRLRDEPLSDLRARVTAYRAAPRAPRVSPPNVAGGATLSRATLAKARINGMTPEQVLEQRKTAVRRYGE